MKKIICSILLVSFPLFSCSTYFGHAVVTSELSDDIVIDQQVEITKECELIRIEEKPGLMYYYKCPGYDGLVRTNIVFNDYRNHQLTIWLIAGGITAFVCVALIVGMTRGIYDSPNDIKQPPR